MSQEDIAPSPQGNDNAPTTHQGERPLSPITSDIATGQQSRQATPENRLAEASPQPNSDPSPQLNGNSNENCEDKDAPETEDSAAEEPTASSKEPLEDYSWEDIEQRFTARMEECKKNEETLGLEFNELLKVFRAWASVTENYEEERASKRLRTRIAYIQGKELDLEKKRQHYVKVVKAFESALALLEA